MGILGLTDAIAGQRHIIAVHRGLKLNIPLFVIGAFAIMISNISFIWYQQVMTFLFGPNWSLLSKAIAAAALNGVSILIVISTSYFLAEMHKQVKLIQVHPLMAALVSFACLIALLYPFTPETISGLPFVWTGVEGIFLALVTALTSTEFFLWLCSVRKITIRPTADIGDPILSQALMYILPAAATVLCFGLVKLGAAGANIQDIHTYFNSQVIACFQTIESPLLKMVLLNFFVHLFWFFGIHGNNIMEPVLMHIQLFDMQIASESWNVLTKTFQDGFILIGGAGSTIGLMLALFLVSRRSSTAWLIRLSIVPAVFNINELLLFCLPIVLNPIFLIPFLLVPLASACLSYSVINMGWVPTVVHKVHWTTPPLISGYIATNSWSGAVLQLINIIVATAIYLPFVKLHEKRKVQEVAAAFNQALEESGANISLVQKQLMIRQDGVGTLARMLAADLKNALAKGELFLEYQPQVNYHNQVFGVEALLRWSHKLYGRVLPPLIIAVAEEAGLIQDVGKWVVRTACRQMREWKNMGVEGVRISVNVSAVQLQSDCFPDVILDAIKMYGLQPQDIEIEITENVALNNDAKTNHNLSIIREAQIRIAIDDFGMGHTSLRYLKHFPVDTLKIDRMLSRDVTKDRNCQEIISSIVSLCASLEIEIIVEYVETQEQRDSLQRLGCVNYQGYYYSPPLASSQTVGYIRVKNHSGPGETSAAVE